MQKKVCTQALLFWGASFYVVLGAPTGSTTATQSENVVKLEKLIGSMAQEQVARVPNVAGVDDLVLLEEENNRIIALPVCKCNEYHHGATAYTNNCMQNIGGQQICQLQSGNAEQPCPSFLESCRATATIQPSPAAEVIAGDQGIRLP